jgi:hypothetical protein
MTTATNMPPAMIAISRASKFDEVGRDTTGRGITQALSQLETNI